jgi:integrase/recombinase XerD
MSPYKRLKEPKYHPDILTREEVRALIDTERNLKYKAIIAVLYSSGIRLEECVNLDVTDIDSSRMVIHVRHGKV